MSAGALASRDHPVLLTEYVCAACRDAHDAHERAGLFQQDGPAQVEVVALVRPGSGWSARGARYLACAADWRDSVARHEKLMSEVNWMVTGFDASEMCDTLSLPPSGRWNDAMRDLGLDWSELPALYYSGRMLTNAVIPARIEAFLDSAATTVIARQGNQ